MMSTDSIYLFL